MESVESKEESLQLPKNSSRWEDRVMAKEMTLSLEEKFTGLKNSVRDMQRELRTLKEMT